jgi:hypothetical protein
MKNFTEDRTFKVLITKSEKMTSVTLFLIAISKMADNTKETRNENPGPRRNQTILSQRLDKKEIQTRSVGILGYANDWVLYTRNHQMLRAQNNMQAALDRVEERSEANGFTISQEKTKAMHIWRIRSKPENHPEPTIRMNGQILEVVDTHRILGLILDIQLTWRPHIETVEAKCSKRLNLLRHLAGTKWGRINQPY